MLKRVLQLIIFIGGLSFLSFQTGAAQEDLMAFEMRWSPDGRWISVGSNNGVWVFDVENLNAPPRRYGVVGDSSFFVGAFNPVYPLMAFANQDLDEVYVVDLETGAEVYTIYFPEPDSEFFSVYYDLAFSEDGKHLFVPNASLLDVFDALSGERIAMSGYSNEWITSLDTLPDGTVYAGNFGGEIARFSPEGVIVEQRRIISQDEPLLVGRLEVTPDGERMLILSAGSSMNNLYEYELGTGALTLVIGSGEPTFAGFDLSPDGTRVAFGSFGVWMLYDATTFEELLRVESPVRGEDYLEGVVYSLAFSPDGSQLATIQSDGQLHIWDATTGEKLASVEVFNRGVNQRWG